MHLWQWETPEPNDEEECTNTFVHILCVFVIFTCILLPAFISSLLLPNMFWLDLSWLHNHLCCSHFHDSENLSLSRPEIAVDWLTSEWHVGCFPPKESSFFFVTSSVITLTFAPPEYRFSYIFHAGKHSSPFFFLTWWIRASLELKIGKNKWPHAPQGMKMICNRWKISRSTFNQRFEAHTYIPSSHTPGEMFLSLKVQLGADPNPTYHQIEIAC